MRDSQQFQLIDGTFTPAEASQVLLSLVKSKIDYHSRERFSHKERFGHDCSKSAQRLRELEKLEAALKALLAAAADANQNLKIDGRIDITFV